MRLSRSGTRVLCGLLALAFASGALADEVTWSETATLKTKRVHDGDGKLVYEANFDKRTGEPVGPVLDERAGPRGAPKPTAAAGKARGKVRDTSGDVLLATEGGRTLLRRDSLLRIKLLTPLDSRANRSGDRFRFVTIDGLHVRGKRVVAPDTEGAGEVFRVRRRGSWGRPGALDLKFNFVVSSRGHRVPLDLTKRAREVNESEGYAAGASMLGLAVLGPLGLAAGAFVKGRDVSLQRGAIFYVGVNEDVDISDEVGG